MPQFSSFSMITYTEFIYTAIDDMDNRGNKPSSSMDTTDQAKTFGAHRPSQGLSSSHHSKLYLTPARLESPGPGDKV